ncbi:MAG TPA: thiamine-phosphate kinase [Acidimicrobiales bacterium]|nr:thiamine-phosphate kinase [Acidimicrobiales bacterium]
MTGEFAVIEAIRSLLPGPGDAGQVWIGDDSAVLPVPAGDRLLLAADTVVAGVHADLGLTGLDDLGWKAMAACVSDIAAMGGDPLWALVTVAGASGEEVRSLYAGVADASRCFGCPVVGGDLTGGPGLVVTVAVAGTCDGAPVLRSGARAGDEVWVTGPLGASAAGLRRLRSGGSSARDAEGADLVRSHARPVPRLAEGRAARSAGATAMIDVSDGLAADVGHICRQSGIGVSLDYVPAAKGATTDEAMSGGEDFELVFCAPPGAPVGSAFEGLRPPVRIGECRDNHQGVRLAGAEVAPAGWEHQL